MKRRGFLFGAISLASVPFVGKVSEASALEPSMHDAALWSTVAIEAKPLTTEGMAKTLLVQADKARKQGMRAEASILANAAKAMLALPGRVGVVPCDTDSDCERKNPHLRDDKADPLGLRAGVRQF